MYRILIVSAVFPPEPVVSARVSEDIKHELQNRGCIVKVLHPKPTRPNGFVFAQSLVEGPDEVISDSFTCPKPSLYGRFRESFSFGKASYVYVKQHHDEIDIIYANTWPLFAQYYLAKAAKKYGVPYFMHIQDIYPESYCSKMPSFLGKLLCWLLIPIDKYVLRNAEGVFAISPLMKSYLSKTRGISDNKVLQVRNWQDDNAFIGSYKPIVCNHKRLEVMYLGSINPTANVSSIIRAFSLLLDEQFHLSIIGNGSEKENCQDLAKSLGVDAAFDTVTPEEVATKQREADMLVLCLKRGVAKTATPSKLTAYMFTGRPIVAAVDLDSDCANIIREAGCGLVVEPENEVALADALREMACRDTNALNKLGKAAFEYANNHLSRKRNLNSLVDRIIKENNGSSFNQ